MGDRLGSAFIKLLFAAIISNMVISFAVPDGVKGVMYSFSNGIIVFMFMVDLFDVLVGGSNTLERLSSWLMRALIAIVGVVGVIGYGINWLASIFHH